MNRKEIARYIDHTALKADTTPEQIDTLCQEARDYEFASVCVNPVFVPQAAKLLAGSQVEVCTVVGFPLGATSTASKVKEAEIAIDEGAQEVDMVLAIGLLKAGEYARVRHDVQAVADTCHAKGAILKVIIENALLTDAEKVMACELCQAACADFVKTSTGFASSGAKVDDVALMRQTVGPDMGIKAAGGIGDYETAMAMIKAGATRIGASRSINIVEGAAE